MINLKHVNLSPNLFPLTIEALNEKNEIVWTKTVEQPEAVEIPALHKIHNSKIKVRVYFADGTQTESFYH
jgi:hypothetical protein